MRLSIPLLALIASIAASPTLAADTVAEASREHGRRILELLDQGDRKALTAYLDANYSEQADGRQREQATRLLDMTYRLSRGAKFDSYGPVEEDNAVVYYRNPTTGGQEGMKVLVEQKAPFRITGVAYQPPAQPLKLFEDSTPMAEKMKAIDAFIARLAKADGFSGVVLIAAGDKVLLNKAYGLAERTFSAPNRLDTKFNLGSMDKMFTSVAIARLVEQGKLSWDDPLSKFMPDFPDAESARKIKLKHLASHTSGLGSYFNEAFQKSSRGDYRNVADYLKIAADGEGLQFEPGSKWDYSNTGMLVLGRVVEIVTGQDYYEHMRETLFLPLGMTGTDFYALDSVTPNMAQAYEARWLDKGLETRNAIYDLVAVGGPAGGGYATAPDLLRFAQAFKSGKVVKPETAALLTSPKPEIASPHYGYGFDLGRLAPQGMKVAGHGGDSPGACTVFDMIRIGEQDYTVIILANSAMGTCHRVARMSYQALPAQAKP